MPQCLPFVVGVFLAILPTSSALQEQVISSFVFSRHGDRTPLYSSDTSILTPYGAQQMYTAGSNFRDRYLTTTFDAIESTAIRDISHYQLNVDEVSVYSTDYQYVVGSAQAFLQGLYPPLRHASNLNYTQLLGVSELANGTNVVAPLDGYQYPDINTLSSYDLRSVWIDGAAHCPAYTGRLVEYYNTSDFDFLYRSTLQFYQGLEDFLEDQFTPNDLGYFNAYYLYDWLQYEARHNSTFRINSTDMTRARILAADWVHALFSNGTDSVKSIAGRSLARQILNSFQQSIENQGRTNKLNLWFGDFAPMVSFAALARLTSDQNAIFYDVPQMSSSYVFELVAVLDDADTSITFPNTSDLFVRFLYQNGTDPYSKLVPYPLFGHSPSQDLISYSEFVYGLAQFSLSGIKEWCTTCASYAIFCPAYTDGSSFGNNSRHRGLSPAVAGVIGALVALAVAAILFGLLMALAGFRVRRERTKKKSDLAGFKGSQKLASDQDLTIPKGGAEATVTTTESEVPRGHERVGSWELRDQAKRAEAGQIGAIIPPRPRRASFEDDDIQVNPYTPAVKPHDQV